MGNHRADSRGSRRVRSETPDSGGSRAVGTRAQRSATGPSGAGKRKASKHSASRGPLFRGLPSPPILLGVAALAVSVGGAVTVGDPSLLTGGKDDRLAPASALSGASDVANTNLLDARTAAISRDSRRDALADAADEELVEQAENEARERNAALAKFAKQAEAQAAKIALNQWVLPLASYHLSAGFGEVSYLWTTVHTGLDMSAPSGTPIRSVANGVVKEVGYDGSYGNKTVVTLEDGTEIWYCHQTSYLVDEGDTVRAGEVIGSVGSTGNSTGPHLHIEVRPGGGDPVDPYEAMLVHGLQP